MVDRDGMGELFVLLLIFARFIAFGTLSASKQDFRSSLESVKWDVDFDRRQLE